MSNQPGDEKKRLRVLSSSQDKTVLPEVLPDPRAKRAPGAPRGRTLAHMQRLLAASAAIGVASVSCHKEKVTEAHDNDGSKGGCNPFKKDSNMSSGGSSGYAVVDPMPTPAYCPGIAPLIKATASFSQREGATWAFVMLPLPTAREDFKYISDAPVVAYGATLVSHEVTADGVKATLKLDPGVAEAGTGFSVSFKGTCNQGPATLSASVNWQGSARTSPTTTVYVSEY